MNQDSPHTKKFDYTTFYSKNKPFSKWDILIIGLIVVALVSSIVLIVTREHGEFVEIYYKGELLEKHSLAQNKTIEIEKKGYNQITIVDKKVFMASASCKNQICVHSGSINKVGQRIVCAPNAIVVVITGKEKLDGITGGGQDVN